MTRVCSRHSPLHLVLKQYYLSTVHDPCLLMPQSTPTCAQTVLSFHYSWSVSPHTTVRSILCSNSRNLLQNYVHIPHHRSFGLGLSSVFQLNWKRSVLKTGSDSFFKEGERDIYCARSLERTNLIQLYNRWERLRFVVISSYYNFKRRRISIISYLSVTYYLCQFHDKLCIHTCLQNGYDISISMHCNQDGLRKSATNFWKLWHYQKSPNKDAGNFSKLMEIMLMLQFPIKISHQFQR